MPQFSTPAEVLAAIASGWDAHVAGVLAVPAADREVPGPFGWSIKDVVANIMGWERELIAVLKEEPPHLAMGLDAATYDEGETDVINAIMYAKYRSLPFDDVWALATATHNQLVETVAALPPDRLAQPLAGEDEQPANEDRVSVLDWIAQGTWEHYRDHTRDLVVIAEHARLARV